MVALLAAAGRGTRLGGPIPKAFVTLRGRSLVERSLRAMLTSEVVDEIIILVSPDMEDYARELLNKRSLLDTPEGVSVRLVHGGGERADSVWAGLQAIDHDDAIVLIHDSARALTPPGMIARVTGAVVAGARAVIPVVPVTDTIKRVNGGSVVDTPTVLISARCRPRRVFCCRNCVPPMRSSSPPPILVSSPPMMPA